MKTIQKVKIEPVYCNLIPHAFELEFGKIYISKENSVAIHLCLCGCRKEVVTPLHLKQWQLIDNNGMVTLRPSIGNFQYCNSHYIITDNVACFV